MGRRCEHFNVIILEEKKKSVAQKIICGAGHRGRSRGGGRRSLSDVLDAGPNEGTRRGFTHGIARFYVSRFDFQVFKRFFLNEFRRGRCFVDGRVIFRLSLRISL